MVRTRSPKQPNFCDCGVYALLAVKYFMKQLAEAPSMTTQHLLSCARSSSGFLGANWFPASDAARLRLELRVEVVDLLLAQLPSAAPHEVRGSLEEQRGAAVQELRKPRGVPAPLPFVVRASHYCARSVPFDDA